MTDKRNQKTTSSDSFSRLRVDFGKNERGATSIEYGLIVGLVFLAIVGAIRGYANSTSDMYSEIQSEMSTR
ncbi:MAG: Flp family type IVb pilin [Pseudomonadota bacterium]